MKIAVIGAGRVGSSIAYTLVLKQLCQHLVIAGRNLEKAKGDALDLEHSLAFYSRPIQIEAATNDSVLDTDIIVITASAELGKQIIRSRMELGEPNTAMFRELIPTLAANNPKALLLIVTNPVDVMTYAATKLSGFLPHRVMGIGTLVDSARFRMMLSNEAHIHPDDLRAYILGEHGPNQFPILSSAEAGGERIQDTPHRRDIFTKVINAGFEVFQLKGYTDRAIATATCLVIQAIIFDENRTMPLVVHFDEWQGIHNNCFSIPVVVGRNGVTRHLYPVLNDEEQGHLLNTAKAVKNAISLLIPDLLD